MDRHAWIEEFPGAVTVCDENGTIIEMNGRSARTFAGDGGAALIGKNVLDCHPEPARTKLTEMMDGRRTNVYTIEKNGAKKLIYQAPWFRDGKYGGFVELSLEVPLEMPHFVRTSR
ncbi:MAG: PAS domain-containing protein [Candidatus Aminicenantes bacterium]|nr:PAS domain-containing protein [Candidatus Aminicenantes bacterium]